MSKIQKVSEAKKTLLRRKSAFVLPNNPTEAGYKANDIKDALWKPILDAEESTITEINRIVDELNINFESNERDYMVSERNGSFVGSSGIVYNIAEGVAEAVNVDKDDPNKYRIEFVEIPATFFKDGVNYPVVSVNLQGRQIKDLVVGENVEVVDGVYNAETITFKGNTGIKYSSSLDRCHIKYPRQFESTYKSYACVSKEAYDTIPSLKQEADRKVEKLGAGESERVYTTTTTGGQSNRSLSKAPSGGGIPLYSDGGNIQSNTPEASNDVVNKEYADSLFGAYIDYEMNPSNYQLTVNLKNKKGEIISTSMIDLPLEAMILGASYADSVLTLNIKTPDGSLENQQIQVNISDLISGLVSQDTFTKESGRLDKRINDFRSDFNEFVDQVGNKEIYGSYAQYAEEASTASNYSKGGKIDKSFLAIKAKTATQLALNMDNNYVVKCDLKNEKGEVLSTQSIDLPIESLIANAEYKNKKLVLTFQSGNKLEVDIVDLISGLVNNTTTINGYALKSNISLTAGDVGAYAKNETYSKTEAQTLVNNAVNTAVEELEAKIQAHQNVAMSAISIESEAASDSTGSLEARLKAIEKRLKALENI